MNYLTPTDLNAINQLFLFITFLLVLLVFSLLHLYIEFIRKSQEILIFLIV